MATSRTIYRHEPCYVKLSKHYFSKHYISQHLDKTYEDQNEIHRSCKIIQRSYSSVYLHVQFVVVSTSTLNILVEWTSFTKPRIRNVIQQQFEIIKLYPPCKFSHNVFEILTWKSLQGESRCNSSRRAAVSFCGDLSPHRSEFSSLPLMFTPNVY